MLALVLPKKDSQIGMRRHTDTHPRAHVHRCEHAHAHAHARQHLCKSFSIAEVQALDVEINCHSQCVALPQPSSMPQPNMYVHFDAPAPGGVLTFASKPLPFALAMAHVSRDLAIMQFIGASSLVHVDVQHALIMSS